MHIRSAEVAPIPPVAGLTQGQQQQAGRRGKKENREKGRRAYLLMSHMRQR